LTRPTNHQVEHLRIAGGDRFVDDLRDDLVGEAVVQLCRRLVV
jgi:hypothetical protein